MQVKRLAMVSATALMLLCAGCATGNTPPASHVTTPVAAQSRQTQSAVVIAQHMGINAHAYNATTDPNHLMGRQHGYTSKAAWGPNRYSSIEVFGNMQDMQSRFTELKGLTCPFGDGYDYTAGTAILRLACNYTPAQAKDLKAKFLTAVG